MICANCEKAAKKSLDVFTLKERIHVLTSAVSMLKSMHASGIAYSNDLAVSNSVITKMLVSFDKPSQEILIQQLKKSSGIEITLGKCPHGLAVV